MEKSISSYGLVGKARTRPNILRVVLGPYVQYCPYEASEQKVGKKPKSELKKIELIVNVAIRFVFNKQASRMKKPSKLVEK